MTVIALHKIPESRRVASEQMRTVGKVLEPFLFTLLGMWLLFDAVMIGVAEQAASLQSRHLPFKAVALEFSPEISIVAGVTALLLSLIVWLDDAPAKRTYLLMMPVDRSTHILLKVFAGWSWCMLATAGFLLNMLAIAFVTAKMQPFLAAVPHRPTVLWYYLVPFTGASVAYLFGSAAAVGSRVPIIWLAGPPLLLVGVALFAEEYRLHTLKKLYVVMDGEYGLFRALGYDTSNGYDFAGRILTNGFSPWAIATLLWLLIAGGVLVYTSGLRREPK